MSPSREPTLPQEPGHLDDRVLSALQGLSGRLAFSGLRRVLGTHPESLARSLRRLEREGLVERVDGGYRALGPPSELGGRPAPEPRAIAAIDLPPGTTPAELLGRLVGHWFGSLRWVGLLDRPQGRLLAWARREGGRLVLLGVRGSTLSVYASPGRPDDDAVEAEDAAYELLVHAVEALRPGAEGTPLSPPTLRAFAASPAAPALEN